MSKKQNIPFFIIVAAISCTLINMPLFGSPTMAAYFGFVITTSIFLITACIISLKSTKAVILANPLPLYLFVALGSYFLLQAFINGQGTNFRHIYLLVCILLLASLSILLSSSEISFLQLSKAITIIAGIEGIICLLQCLKLIQSQNSFFSVTGSWVNPNVTAMFFVMALPAVLQTIFQQRLKYKALSLIILALITASLILLKCRTAYIGAFIVCTIVLNAQYKIVATLRRKFSVLQIMALSTLFIFVIIPLVIYSYHAKQASADGRALIWKISLDMIADNPLTGHGYGRFEHDYNLYQAKYFSLGKGTVQEAANASFVKMAYNEFLENGVEGGVIGLMLFAGALISLLNDSWLVERVTNEKTPSKTTLRKNNKSVKHSNNLDQAAAYAGIAAFTAMSIFNFTVQAIPVMCLLVIYAAVRITNPLLKMKMSAPKRFPIFSLQSATLTSRAKSTILSLFILIGIYTCITETSKAKASIQNRDASILAMEGDKKEALSRFKNLEDELNCSSVYLINYGKTLFAAKKFFLALNKFNTAKNLTSDPDLYMLLGNCYYKTGSYGEARNAYTTSRNIVPNRFAPRYALMKLYNSTSDNANALLMAHELIALQPKVNTEKAIRYKKEAKEVIKSIVNSE